MRLADALKFSLKKIPRLDAELIICNILSIDRPQMLTHGDEIISDKILKKIKEQVAKRAEGFPTAYILGEKDFYKHTFKVAPGVLIPRPETELLVEGAIEHLRGNQGSVQVLDMGCGSGCLGLSIAAELKNVFLTAVDISKDAIRITEDNARQLGIANRTKTKLASVENLSVEQKFNCIVANPPYIAHHDLDIDPSVKRFEPGEALFAEENGYEKIRAWSLKAWDLLEKGGFWATEIGHTQSERTYKILETAGFNNIKITKDLSGKDRMVSGVKLYG